MKTILSFSSENDLRKITSGCSKIAERVGLQFSEKKSIVFTFVNNHESVNIPASPEIGGSKGLDRLQIAEYIFDSLSEAGSFMLIESYMTPIEAAVEISAGQNMIIDRSNSYFYLQKPKDLNEVTSFLLELTYHRPGYLFKSGELPKVTNPDDDFTYPDLVVASIFDGEGIAIVEFQND